MLCTSLNKYIIHLRYARVGKSPFFKTRYWSLFLKLNDALNVVIIVILVSDVWLCQEMERDVSSVVRAFAHGAMGCRIDPCGMDPLSYFSFQPVLQDWCNKGRGMCYPVCGMVHIKEPLLLIRKSSSRFPFSLTQWSLTICLMPYNRN